MLSRMALSLACVVVTWSAVRAEERPSPGNPPVVLVAQQIDNAGNLVLYQYRTIFIQPAGALGGGGPIYNDRSTKKVSLLGVKIYTKDGDLVSIDDARKRLGNQETAILVSSYGARLSLVHRNIFRENVLLFAFPKDAPEWTAMQGPELPVRN